MSTKLELKGGHHASRRVTPAAEGRSERLAPPLTEDVDYPGSVTDDPNWKDLPQEDRNDLLGAGKTDDEQYIHCDCGHTYDFDYNPACPFCGKEPTE